MHKQVKHNAIKQEASLDEDYHWVHHHLGPPPANYHKISPSARDVSNVTVAALRRPAGRLNPILSSFSRSARPPFLDLALEEGKEMHNVSTD